MLHGGNLAIRLLLTFLVANYSYSSVYVPLPEYSTKTNTFSIKNSDVATAKKIILLRQQVRKNKVKPSLVKTVNKEILRNKLLRHLGDWSGEIKKVSALSGNRSHFNFCEKLKLKNSSNTRYCFNSFFTKTKIDSAFFNLLKEKSSIALRNTNKDIFLRAIKKIKKPNHFKMISNTLINDLYLHQRYATKKMMRTLLPTRKVNHFKKMVLGAKSFKTNRNKLRKLLKEKNTKEIISSANSDIKFFKKFERSFFIYAKDLNQDNKTEEARLVIKLLIEKSNYFNSDYYFEYLWSYLKEDNLKEAYVQFIENKNVFSKIINSNDSRFRFWIARLMNANNKKKEATDLFENIINTSPLSYYAIMSAKELQLKNGQTIRGVYTKHLDETFLSHTHELQYSKEEIASLKRIKLWSTLKSEFFLRKSINEYLGFGFKNSHLKSALILNSVDDYLKSFQVLYSGLNQKKEIFNQTTLRLLFPDVFFKKLKTYSKRVNPIIALSLIRQESAFNKNARSHVGARGLMQIMPNTGKRFYKRLRRNQLYNSNLNIKIGTKYLGKLQKRYENNLVYTLSAYNAGESRVKRWRKNLFEEDQILQNIEQIPFSETRKYVKLIFRNIFFYKLLNTENISERKIASNEAKRNYLFDIYLGF